MVMMMGMTGMSNSSDVDLYSISNLACCQSCMEVARSVRHEGFGDTHLCRKHTIIRDIIEDTDGFAFDISRNLRRY